MSGLFKRWQQRRDEVAREEESDEAEQAELQQAQAAEQAPSEPEGEEVAAEEEVLPNPEEIEEGGSFAAFMKPDVDPLQRKEALRSLWKQPHYNVRDGLCEYDLDYAAQPKLTAKVAAELAEKVFRHVVKEVDEEETQLAEQAPATPRKDPELTSDGDADGQIVADLDKSADKPQSEA
ncbi:DUF3306 domain-containing protein [Ferrimonas marina]|uniref:DUF3306 domain-containing protein n=1 Tax=Ferrimonas marina TaxID=299255 RepID=A0A1M5XWJ6_9GAMM|nr:DUF3306 domain-containing protein [Ferrimonas marina]SHI03908.1 Protein of unknown function [Ferrimonas marina]